MIDIEDHIVIIDGDLQIAPRRFSSAEVKAALKKIIDDHEKKFGTIEIKFIPHITK